VANELFDEEPPAAPAPKNGNGAPKAAPKAKAAAAPAAKSAAAPAAAPSAAATSDPLTAGLTDPFGGGGATAVAEAVCQEGFAGMAAESSSEPSGGAPLMAAPTSPAAQTAPKLPERIAEAAQGESSQSMFAGEGLTFERRYTRAGEDVFNTIDWELRTAAITGEGGEVVFEQKDCEIPKPWSMLATNVVVSKYFRGKIGTPQREKSVKQLISRVADTIAKWGKAGNYFATEADGDAFHDELKYLLLHQYMAFNSPVWFNLGVPGERPQVSACFINSVDDTMESILTLAKTEGMLFKWGSGTGTNLSVLRSSKESLRGGGTASGPVSFMRGFDAFAGAIKSGGKTRRAAKMVILNADHPDIEEFIGCKADAEKKAHALIEAGYSGAFNVPNGAYDSVFFQNANHSVRATDDFMRAVELDRDWTTCGVTNGEPMDTFRARDLMHKIAQAAWVCGDPGMQFDTTANRWHTCANTARINASNPCSEFFFLDDTACNLASLNLMRFRKANREFDLDAFQHAVRVTISAMEIMVGNAAYPTDKITVNSFDYRPLGLGYANLGALLMSRGVPYDSDEGRSYAAVITALLSGTAYHQSAKMAGRVGPFAGYERNKQPMQRVMQMHRDHVEAIHAKDELPSEMLDAARQCWDDALALGRDNGFRNSQISVLAPTGTIGFLMDCDTTGVEPDIALVKFKSLVGGGMFKIVNQTVPEALERLGYSASERKAILDYIDQNDTIEGAPGLADEHLPVFDCAFRPRNGTRTIEYMGHIRMMAAVQPFISGAISKTVNMPHDATPDDIAEAYLQAWKLGVKALAIYRDGSKKTQPLSTGATNDEKKSDKAAVVEARPLRRRLPDERTALTHKFSVGGHEGYLTVGLYPDGTPGEIFVTMSKEGSVVSGLMDSFATSISLALQYGVPLRTLVDKFMHSRFEPSGFTGNPQIPMAKSIMDYLFRYLALKFLDREERAHVGLLADQQDEYDNGSAAAEPSAPTAALAAPVTVAATVGGAGQPGPTGAPAEGGAGRGAMAAERQVFVTQADAPPCPECGSITTRNGACYRCNNCGTSIGCS
jgi:ribonucleoside-diphosphate reductase alpha chain